MGREGMGKDGWERGNEGKRGGKERREEKGREVGTGPPIF